MSCSYRAGGILTLVALLVALTPTYAVAQVDIPDLGGGGISSWEGSWNSYIERAATGFDSRTWTKKNPAIGGAKIRFEGCHEHYGAEFESTRVQLTRETPFFLPHENRGRKTFYCAGVDTNDWGSQDAGDYHFTITHINGCTSCSLFLDVEDVKVKY